jgi:UDP-glucose 4-epimerase
VYNLGTGKGTTVKEVISLFEEARGVKLKVEIVGKREGDVKSAVADVSKIKKILGWEAKHTVLEALALQPNFDAASI